MRKLVRCLIAVLALWSSAANAQLVDVINEVAFTGAPLPDGYTAYRIYARLQDSNDRMNAVFGSTTPSPVHHLLLGSTDDGTIFNHSFGGHHGDQLNCGLWGFFPDSKWDSYVTIGRTNSSNGNGCPPVDCTGTAGGVLSISTPSNMVQGAFAFNGAPGAFTSFQSNLTLVDGAWFIVNDGSCNGLGQAPDNRVLLAQVTVPTGTLTYNLNVSVFDQGIGDNQMIYVHCLQDEPGFVGSFPEIDGTAMGLVYPWNGATNCGGVAGCMDPTACNYNVDATADDGSCTYPGCTDMTACNYDANAGCNDNSCTFPGCTTPSACNYNANAGCDDGSCTTPGCTEPTACNYDASASCDNSTCDFTSCVGCMDSDACNYDADATIDSDACTYPGCTDPSACNYNGNAGCDDGSCTTPGCTDPSACNYDQNAGCSNNSCTYPGCINPNACNYNANAGCANGSCIFPGCMDQSACNYNADAGCENGSCLYPGCTDSDACNYNADAGCAGGLCVYPGCTDSAACNYNDNAGCADGSCVYAGCTDVDACNYNADAGCSDNSCVYPGCDDVNACNFTPGAGCNDGSCTYPGCTDDAACNYNPDAGCSDGSCNFDCTGCTDVDACNYDATATQDDGSCEFTSCVGCTDSDACNYDASASHNDGSCTYPGCTDESACNYNANAGCDDGNCDYPGCTDSGACNYNGNAGCDDGSCEYSSCTGCTDPGACNYDMTASSDDGSCDYSCLGCTDATACNYNADASVDDGSCDFSCYGCTNDAACNFDAGATIDDGSCTFDCSGCTDSDACNYDASASQDDGSCDYSCYGCTDSGACNYDANASIDNGTCDYSCVGCTDESACNYDNDTTIDDGSCDYSCYGCTDDSACNFSADATINDGSCEYSSCYGCTNPTACNYDAGATYDNGTCDYSCYGCTDASACNYDGDATMNDGSCDYSCYGCTDDSACNYDSDATINEGCDYSCYGCTDDSACNYDSDATINEGCDYSCYGCTDSDACNFNSGATQDNGSCDYSCYGCTDPNALNYNPDATINDGTCEYDQNQCFFICPADAYVQCGDSTDPEFTGAAYYVGGCSLSGYTWYTDGEVVGNGCHSEFVRTWYGLEYIITGYGDTGLNYSDICTQVIHVVDTEGPVFNNVPEPLTVACITEVPEQSDCSATDNCSEEITYDKFCAQTGYELEECELTTAIGPGADWAIWLPGIPTASSAYWVFSGQGTLVTYGDGTAHIFGDIVNTANASEGFHLNLWFENRANWTTWSSMGRSYKDDLGYAAAGGNLWTTWDFFELVGGFSNLDGYGDMEGDNIYLQHFPFDYYFGFQCGEAANNKNDNFGMSGWFAYEGIVDGQEVSGNGDLNVDKECEQQPYNSCDDEMTCYWMATDECGNSSFTSQTITIIDDVPPVFYNCPESVTIQCDAEIPAVATDVYAEDNCSTAEIVDFVEIGPVGNDCYAQLIRRWTAQDACGNESVCEQIITIVDTTAPEFTFVPGNITVQCSDDVQEQSATATDNCNSATVGYWDEVAWGNCPNNYTIYRTWYAYDNCQNYNYASQTITVHDTTAPVFDPFTAYIYVECDDLDDVAPLTATDNCGGSVEVELVNQVLMSGGCLGTWQYTYTAYDACGNHSTAIQYISMQDLTPPTIDCPGEVIAECDNVPSADDLGVTAWDNCNYDVELTWTSSETPGDCENDYYINIHWHAVDYCENHSDCYTTIHVMDTTAPWFESVPEDQTVECSDALPEVVYPTAYDNCDQEVEIEYTSEIHDGECPQEYWQWRIFRAFDNCGNYSAPYVQYIHVVDTTAPSMEGTSMLVIECGDEVPYVEPYAWDNCSQNIAIDYADYSTISPWFFYSNGGNGYVDFSNLPDGFTIGGSDSGSGSDIFTAAATTACQVTIDFDWSYVSADDYCGLNGSYYDQFAYAINGSTTTITENVEGGGYVQSGHSTIVVPAGSLFDLRITAIDDICGLGTVDITNLTVVGEEEVCPFVDCKVRVFTATDECGNSSNFNQVIMTEDTTPPVIEMEPEVSVPCDQYDNTVYATAYDSCSDAYVVICEEDLHVSGQCQGHIIRTYCAYDECGNSSTAQQILNLVDYVAPYVECPGDFTVECGFEYGVPTPYFWDNCDDEVAVVQHDTVSETDGCTTWVTYSFTGWDNCNNHTDCSFTVTIQDTLDPWFNSYDQGGTFQCDQDITYGFAVAYDYCDEQVDVSYTQDTIPGECPNSYTIVRTYTAVDDCGNDASFDVNYYVYDWTDPTFTYVPSDVTIECDEEVPFVNAEATDNCGTATVTHIDYGPYGDSCESQIERLFIATDECGNEAYEWQYIYIEDTTPPTIVYQPEISLPCDNYGGVYAEATDNCNYAYVYICDEDQHVSGECEGHIIRTYCAYDYCGNYATAQQIITLYDNTPPSVECPSDFTVECGFEYSTPTPSFWDNCDQEVAVVSGVVSETDGCTTWLHYSFVGTDNCGNSTPCGFTITIEDTLDPWFYMYDEGGSYQCDETIEYGYAAAYDYCDEEVDVTYTTDTIAGDCPQSYTIVRTYTATDDCGNTASFDAYYYVSDTTPPSMEGQSEVVVECGDEVPYVEPYAWDNCDADVAITYNDYSTISPWFFYIDGGNGYVDFSNLPDGFTIGGSDSNSGNDVVTAAATTACQVTIDFDWSYVSADDYCGLNGSYYDQFAYAIDGSTTTITENVVGGGYVQSGHSTIVVPAGSLFDLRITATDDICGLGIVDISNLTVSDDQEECPIVDCKVRVFTATDDCGNSSVFSQHILTQDTTAPVLVFAPEINLPCDNYGGIFASSYDVCSDSWVDICADDAVVSGECQGSRIRTYCAYDACGNWSTGQQIIHLYDNTPPQVECPEDYTVQCGFDYDVATPYFWDNCDDEVAVVSGVVSETDGCTTWLHYSFVGTDNCGNSTPCGYTITIVDTLDPWFTYVPYGGSFECDQTVEYGWAAGADYCDDDVAITFSDSTEEGNCPQNYTIVRTWYATDNCGNQQVAHSYYSVYDETAPTLVGCPGDLVLDCDQEVPAPADVWAYDNCDPNVSITYNENCYGECPVDGEAPQCDLVTPNENEYDGCQAAYDFTSWAMWLGAETENNDYYKYWRVTGGSFEEFADGTAHLTATLQRTDVDDVTSDVGGWLVDVYFTGGYTWQEWDAMPYPTGYKADCGGVGANHEDWTYYIMSSATLSGWGDYAGSWMNIVHAPSNQYFGFQSGDGANNLTPGPGAGGWFTYNGVIVDSHLEQTIQINGAGDFAFNFDCCPDYYIVREWCATDCTGNISCCSQTISFGDPILVESNVKPLDKPAPSVERVELASMDVSPNPAKDMTNVYFKSDVNNTLTMDVFDMSGRKVAELFQGNVVAGVDYKTEFNTASLEDGVYYIRLYSLNDQQIKKLIIAR